MNTIKAGRRVAVLSDIHGNVWALESVLRDIAGRGIGTVVNLGDCLYGPLAPAAVADILIDRDILTVCGNEDRLIVERPSENPDTGTLGFVKRMLAPQHLEWLRHLPRTAVTEDGIFMCHGSPADDTEYLLRTVEASGTRVRKPEEVQAAIEGISQPVILCGHDHLPALFPLDDGRIVVDPGSVGLPAYFDDVPFPHVIQAGTPHARYCVLKDAVEGWQAEYIEVVYDWETAAATAEANGRADWASWLRSGKAEPASGRSIP
jgi:predicted phosphodiesterase